MHQSMGNGHNLCHGLSSLGRLKAALIVVLVCASTQASLLEMHNWICVSSATPDMYTSDCEAMYCISI